MWTILKFFGTFILSVAIITAVENAIPGTFCNLIYYTAEAGNKAFSEVSEQIKRTPKNGEIYVDKENGKAYEWNAEIQKWIEREDIKFE